MENLTWSDNQNHKGYKSTINCLIWDKNSDIQLYCNNLSNNKRGLSHESELLEIISRINNGKEKIISMILEDDMFELACDWIKPLQKVRKGGQPYFQNENSELIPRLLTKEEFITYITFDSLEIRFNDDEIIADLFLRTVPDCFSNHFIEVFIVKDFLTSRYRISPNGIVQ